MSIYRYLKEVTLAADVPNKDMKIGERPMNRRLKKRLHKALNGPMKKKKKDGTGPNPD